MAAAPDESQRLQEQSVIGPDGMMAVSPSTRSI
jgi:hypothetical protein